MFIVLFAALFSLALVAVVAGVIFQAAARAQDTRRYPPPGQLVDVGGHRLHLYCTGEGSPTVVMDAGLPGTSLSWRLVQTEVARFTRVCSYDRAGLGWSDPSPNPRTSQRIVEELHTLLTNAGIKPPYVLVGHSFGGFTVRLYAARYPQEVVGIVLVDAIHPSEWLGITVERKKQIDRLARQSRRTAWLARMGVVHLYFFLVRVGVRKVKDDRGMISALKKLPAELLPIVRAFWMQPKTFEAVASQLQFLPESARQVDTTGDYGDIPLIVLSAGNADPIRVAEQDRVARLSSNGKHIVASNSGHWIQLEQPELVVEAIRELIKSAR